MKQITPVTTTMYAVIREETYPNGERLDTELVLLAHTPNLAKAAIHSTIKDRGEEIIENELGYILTRCKYWNSYINEVGERVDEPEWDEIYYTIREVPIEIDIDAVPCLPVQ